MYLPTYSARHAFADKGTEHALLVFFPRPQKKAWLALNQHPRPNNLTPWGWADGRSGCVLEEVGARGDVQIFLSEIFSRRLLQAFTGHAAEATATRSSRTFCRLFGMSQHFPRQLLSFPTQRYQTSYNAARLLHE